MAELSHRVAELSGLVQDITQQFQMLDAATANGPHADLSVQELRLVEFLGDRGPHMMKVLAEFLTLAVNSTTSVVDGLERKALVRRVRSETDRRVVQVELTDAGRVVYESATAEKTHCLEAILGALTDAEQEIFMLLFRKAAHAGRQVVDARLQQARNKT
jgi:DNA-binding MarR family transcriptional regulator